MTVRVDMSQAPARVVLTASLGDLRGPDVPQFLLSFGGDGRADVVIEADAPREMATKLRAAVLMLLVEAEAMADQRRHMMTGPCAGSQDWALPAGELFPALLRAV